MKYKFDGRDVIILLLIIILILFFVSYQTDISILNHNFYALCEPIAKGNFSLNVT